MIKLEKIVMLQELKREGLSISAIARRTGMDRETVRKLLDRGPRGSGVRATRAARAASGAVRSLSREQD